MRIQTACGLIGCLVLLAAAPSLELREGGIIRGPRDQRAIALVFTGHEFGEGGDVILRELERRHARASFFLTGDFLRNPGFSDLVRRIIAGGHYLGPHSDKHLLYCAWEPGKKTLVTRGEFLRDLEDNLAAVGKYGINRNLIGFWLPAYEWYNAEIAQWSSEAKLRLVNFTPGTRSNADYTGEADKNFVSSEAILKSILEREQVDPDGLNGFILLLHIGAGPGRKDKMHFRLGELLDSLSARKYRFERIDTMLHSIDTGHR